MRIRLKHRGPLADKKIDSKSKIDSIIVKEDLSFPEMEVINIYFKGRGSSGILNLTKEEFKSLVDSVQPYLGLIKKPITKRKNRN